MKLRICAIVLALFMAYSSNECIEGETVVKHIETEEPIVEVVEIEEPEKPIVEEVKVEEAVSNKVSLGVCKLTAYCKENYPHVCNNGNGNITATGTVPTVGRTVAVDPSVIPYGSEVIINGHTYIAEDCGGAVKGNKIDILFETHQEALRFGVQYAEVFVVIS